MQSDRVDNKYNDGKIYRIIDSGHNDMYIGSTVKSLSSRLNAHRASYRSYKQGKCLRCCSSSVLFDKYGDDLKIELIENYSCETEEELKRREGYHIKAERCINKYLAGRSDAEYYIDNKEHLSALGRQNYLNNKEAYLQRSRTRNEEYKEELKAYAKKYRQDNSAKIKERKKLYYDAHKDEINAKKKNIMKITETNYWNCKRSDAMRKENELEQKHVNKYNVSYAAYLLLGLTCVGMFNRNIQKLFNINLNICLRIY